MRTKIVYVITSSWNDIYWEEGCPVSAISGIYNCQIWCSIKYLHLAKIMHYFHNWWTVDYPISPFLCETIYQILYQILYRLHVKL